MRALLAVLIAAGLPALAAAQSISTESRPFSGLGPIGLPLPSITPALAPIGLGLSPIGFPTQKTTTTVTRAHRPNRPGQRPGQDRRGRERTRSAVVYVFAPPLYVDLAPQTIESEAPLNQPPPAPPPATPSGILQLDLGSTPRGTQIYIDGYFAGTMEDLSGQIRLEPGPYQVEVRATAHEPLIFDVRIAADRTITYEGALTAVAGSRPAATPTATSTIYVIPGCYLGNVPPERADLPGSCDIGKLTTYRP